MKRIECIKKGNNYEALNIGSWNEVIDYELPMGPRVLQGKVFVGQTSLQVYPAAGLYRYARQDAPIYIIDPKDVPVHDARITLIRDVATKGMEKFIEMLAD